MVITMDNVITDSFLFLPGVDVAYINLIIRSLLFACECICSLILTVQVV